MGLACVFPGRGWGGRRRPVPVPTRMVGKEGVLGRDGAGAIQTFGSQAQWNPHLHCLVSDGLFFREGEFVPGPFYGSPP
jgi:hypothetical protein